MSDLRLDQIPVNACCMSFGEVEIGDNGENAKSAPIRIKARSGGPIEHPFWGRIVHDFSGMRLAKNRLPLDYNHKNDEILGYANHFDFSSGDLYASGAITPWKEDDRASEVMFKMRAGVPYQASIYFGGDGIKVEKVATGQTVAVNGAEFSGPGVVVREWPLRGIAICPYGADENTESMAFSEGKTLTAAEWSEPQKKEIAMEQEQEKPIEQVNENVEVKAVEAEDKGEVVKSVEPESVEVEAAPEELKPEVKPEAVEAAVELSAAEIAVAKLEAEVKALREEKNELAAKFAALENGELPLSAAHVEESTKLSGSMWDDARRSKK